MSGLLAEGIAPSVAVHCVCPRREECRSVLCHQLGPSLSPHTVNVYIHDSFHCDRVVRIVSNLQRRTLASLSAVAGSVIQMCRHDPQKIDFEFLIIMKT